MSDSYVVRNHYRHSAAAVGTRKKKKVLVVFLLLIAAGVVGLAYLVHSSGIFEDSNPEIVPRLAARINLERQAAGLSPVQSDGSLANAALKKSQEVKIASLNYAQGANTNPDAMTNVIIVPKITWAFSNSDFQQQFLRSSDNPNPGFLRNVYDPDMKIIGIGVSSDSYNYYIVTKWDA